MNKRKLSSSSELCSSEFWLLSGILATNLGNAVHILVLGKWIFDLSGSTKAFGGVLAFEQALGFILGILAGPIVDRFSPTRTVIMTELFRGISIILAGLLTFTSSSFVILYIMILFIQLGKPFYKSGIFASEIQLILEDKRAHYNARTVTFMQIGAFAGMWLAGIFISFSVVRWGFIVNGMSFLISALSVAMAQKRDHEKVQADVIRKTIKWHEWSSIFVSEWIEVVKLLRQKKEILAAFVLNSFDIALPQIFNIILVPLVVLKLQNQAFWISGLDSSFAFGAGMSGLFAGAWIQKNGLKLNVLVGLLIQALSFFVLSISSSPIAIVFACLMFGFFNTISWSAWQTWLQKTVTKSERGKLAVVRHMSNSAITAIAVLGAGYLITYGVEFTAVFASILAGIATLSSLVFFDRLSKRSDLF